MTTLAVPIVLAAASAVILAACLFAEYGLPALRDRRARARALADVQERVAELDALPSPAELPQARQPTKAEVRAQRGRRHPIARKRRTGRWG